MKSPSSLPLWMDLGVQPLVTLLLAWLMGLVAMAAAGLNPWSVMLAWLGALGSLEALWGALQQAVGLLLAGLAVAVAWHAGRFNAGGEGQALIGGQLAVQVAAVLLPVMPAGLAWPLVLPVAMAGGAVWALLLVALQLWRQVPVALASLLLVGVALALTGAGALAPPEPRHGALLPAWLPGLSGALALLAALAVGLWLWRTRQGYELRVAGQSEAAARYAGIRPQQAALRALLVSGALAGWAGWHALALPPLGLTPGWVGGLGLAGIAVALVGRQHPLGMLLAALGFGLLFQGAGHGLPPGSAAGSALSLTLLGCVLLSAGALALVVQPMLVALYQGMGPMRLRRAPRDSE